MPAPPEPAVMTVFEEMPVPVIVIPTPNLPKMGVVMVLATTVSVFPEIEPNMDGVDDAQKAVHEPVVDAESE